MDLTILRQNYKFMTVRNRTKFAQTVGYSAGDSVTVPAGATVRISTAGLHQIPDSRLFELVSPKRPELIAAGVITPDQLL